MSMQEAVEHYQRALRLGKKCYKELTAHGSYPYLPALEDRLGGPSMAGVADLGVMEIPMEDVIGTRTDARRNAFAANFMPLLGPDTEFAAKWVRLCDDHLGEAGITDPIRCVEYLGRFYVQEGNKRCSVLKSFGAATVSAYVTRILPLWSEDPEIVAYYEFLHFYDCAHIYQIRFDRPGQYSKLQAALGFEAEHVWSEAERQSFLAGFARFQAVFARRHGEELGLSVSDALLVWLKVYPFQLLRELSEGELTRTLAAVWPDVVTDVQPDPITVDTLPVEPDKGIKGLLAGVGRPSHLQVAFVYSHAPLNSHWVLGHDQGRRYMEAAMEGRVSTKTYWPEEDDDTDEGLMEVAIAQGAQVLFATAPQQIGACRRMAAAHPEVKLLNCSLFMPYTGVRTYYSRIYEAKFLSGVAAGALCRGEDIGYIASYPIFGVPAGINAFALGATLTCPGVKVRLRWSCCDPEALKRFDEEGVRLVSNRDVPTPSQYQAQWGLSRLREDGSREPLLSPFWNWGIFYEQVVGSILDGSWDMAGSHGKGQAINYWWGIQSGVVGMRCAPALPEGARRLVEIMEREVREGAVDPFRRVIRDNTGKERSDGERWFSPEEILKMDWLCENVEGEIPPFETIIPAARGMVRLQGVYREEIPPEKEGVLL